MKKIIVSLVLAAMLLFTVIPFAASAANGTTTVSIVSNTQMVCPGQSVTLSVILTGNPGFKGFNINLAKPVGFTVVEIIPGDMIKNSGFYTPNPQEVLMNFASSNVVTTDGVLFTVVLVADTNATTSTIPTTLAFDSVSMSDANKLPITTASSSEAVVVSHTPAADDSDCTTATECSVCGADIDSGNASHNLSVTSNNDGTHNIDCTTPGCTVADKTNVDCADGNSDGMCDDCNYQFPVTPGCSHITATRVIVITPATCKDAGSGFNMLYCTLCGQTLATFPMTIPATGAHVNEDNDHKCDICSEVLSECVDKNKDGKCDVCGKELTVEHVHELAHTEAKAATCTEDGNLEYWYCAGCDCYFSDAEGKNKVELDSLKVPAAHKVERVEAKAATETEDGNIEYWTCTECGCIWLDAECTIAGELKDVVIPATGHVHELVHTEAKAATCFEEGNLEYWYCAGCNCYFTDAEGKYNIAYLSLIVPVAHKVEHIAAVAPTCFEEGNIEYWYCTECGYAWLDELCTKNTNLKAVILPVSHKIVHVPAVAPTATENGNIEYWYCTECGYAWLDELCTKNTNLKAVILPATGEIVSPETGDVAILSVVALAVVATFGVAFVSFKKREEN